MPASGATTVRANRIRDPGAVARRLLAHYDVHARALPWRSPPGDPRQDPYRVWLSEVMLQQTTVATIRPRFQRFVERWPDVAALAAAAEAEVLSEWAGLGYYARARNLHACARAVAALGGFPADVADLRKLPGLGAYTAAAVAAIAFGEPVAAIDTNVERVVARLAGIARPIADAGAEIRAEAEALVPGDRPGDFAQAMMDLGATLCRPRNPDCGACPLRADCAAFASGTPEAFPAPKIRRARAHRHGIAWWIEREGALWLVRRPTRGMLGGMAALPGPDWTDEAPARRGEMARIDWGFTHFTLDLTAIPRAEPPVGDGWWQPLDRIGEAGLPSLYARLVEAVLAGKVADAA